MASVTCTHKMIITSPRGESYTRRTVSESSRERRLSLYQVGAAVLQRSISEPERGLSRW